MIKTAKQLKDLIRNLSKAKAADAQLLMRNYMMERFLERISLSEYRDKFILKGGMLVAAMVGLDARSTMTWTRPSRARRSVWKKSKTSWPTSFLRRLRMVLFSE